MVHTKTRVIIVIWCWRIKWLQEQNSTFCWMEIYVIVQNKLRNLSIVRNSDIPSIKCYQVRSFAKFWKRKKPRQTILLSAQLCCIALNCLKGAVKKFAVIIIFFHLGNIEFLLWNIVTVLLTFETPSNFFQFNLVTINKCFIWIE